MAGTFNSRTPARWKVSQSGNMPVGQSVSRSGKQPAKQVKRKFSHRWLCVCGVCCCCCLCVCVCLTISRSNGDKTVVELQYREGKQIHEHFEWVNMKKKTKEALFYAVDCYCSRDFLLFRLHKVQLVNSIITTDTKIVVPWQGQWACNKAGLFLNPSEVQKQSITQKQKSNNSLECERPWLFVEWPPRSC